MVQQWMSVKGKIMTLHHLAAGDVVDIIGEYFAPGSTCAYLYGQRGVIIEISDNDLYPYEVLTIAGETMNFSWDELTKVDE